MDPHTVMRLNLGCGNKKKDGFLGVDRFICKAADILCDINVALSFKDDSVSEIYLDNVIEHIPDISRMIKDLVRICKPGARITVLTPHFSSLASWRDPTHLHHLSYNSMDHFEMELTAHYLGGQLKVMSRRLSFGGGLMGLTGRLIFNLSPDLYEKHFCFIFRASTLNIEMTVTK